MIELQDVGVRFSRVARRERTLNRLVHRGVFRVGRWAGMGAPAPQSTQLDHTHGFWALREIDLQVGRGQSLGIVGNNGAGKSTLLQVIAGIYSPTVGQANVRGMVTALLGLNTGFNLELTGHDNIRLSGLLLGLSNEQIKQLAPEIIEFSELGDFINQPVRTYSSGMIARLGFAVSTAVAPDVLLLDEVMGVGDGVFRERSTAKICELIGQARVVCLCSHNMSYIRRHCSRVVWLNGGRLVLDGPCDTVLEAYEQFLDKRVHAAQCAGAARSA